jgi:cell shape-determining protein MreD
MRHGVWIVLGWLGVTLWTAIGARLDVAHLVPDAAVVTVVFVALFREPIPTFITALALGYLCGRAALAPTGLHELMLVACAILTYVGSGRIKGSGALFFATTSAVVTGSYHLGLFLLLAAVRGTSGFASFAATALVPAALMTGVLALVSYPWMVRLERRLSPAAREGLSWQ